MTNHNKDTINPRHTLMHMIAATFALAGGLVLSGCAGTGAVSADVGLIDMRSEMLLSTNLKSANGTYGAGCIDRSGSWSVEIQPDAPLDHAELSVVLNNDDCVLTLTELVTTDGPIEAMPAIVLTAAYKATPSAFDDPIAFYANAKLDAVDFASNFTLTILYSDDPELATDSESADFSEVQSSAEGMGVPSPDYFIDPTPIALSVDADQVVQSAAGQVVVDENMVIAEEYFVVDASGLNTYTELDDAHAAASPAAVGAGVPVADFDLLGAALPQVRTLVFVNIENGVRSYQAFEITFNPAM